MSLLSQRGAMRRSLLAALGAGAVLQAAPAAAQDAPPAPTAAAAPDAPLALVHTELDASAANLDWALYHHGEAGHAIAAQAASRAAGHPLRTGLQPAQPFFDEPQRRALERSRVMTVSTVGRAPFTMAEACARFQAMPGVVVQAAGNEGTAYRTAYQSQQSTPFQCADLILRVGASHNGEIEDYSSRSGPDLVAENPWRLGFRFKLMRTPAEIGQYFQEQRAALLADWLSMRVTDRLEELDGDTSAEAAAARAQIEANAGPHWDALHTAAVRDFDARLAAAAAALPGEADRVAATQRSAAEPATFAELLRAQQGDAPVWRDAEGFVHNSNGTSWSGPSVGGTVAGTLQRYPQLSDEDAVVAALLSARKITAAETAPHALRYRRNARGLSFNDSHAGFGLFDPAGFARIAAEMEQSRAATPDTATRRVTVRPQQSEGNLLGGLRFTVRERGVALRSMVALTVPEGRVGFEGLLLIAPDGTRIAVEPARQVLPGNRELLTVSTSGVLGGPTEGTWRIEGKDDIRAVAELHVVAVQRGSVADRAIARAVETGPQLRREAVDGVVAEERQRWTPPAPAAPPVG